MDEKNPAGYCAVLWFEDKELVGVYLKDDYESWTDVKAGIVGSNLDDAIGEVIPDQLKDDIVVYIAGMREWSTDIYTNDIPAAYEWLRDEEALKGFSLLQVDPYKSLEWITEQAAYYYDSYRNDNK